QADGVVMRRHHHSLLRRSDGWQVIRLGKTHGRDREQRHEQRSDDGRHGRESLDSKLDGVRQHGGRHRRIEKAALECHHTLPRAYYQVLLRSPHSAFSRRLSRSLNRWIIGWRLVEILNADLRFLEAFRQSLDLTACIRHHTFDAVFLTNRSNILLYRSF